METSKHSVPTIFLTIVMTVFIGLMVAFCVGFGVQAFYPAPTYPTYPAALSVPASSGTNTSGLSVDQQKIQARYDLDSQNYRTRSETHDRNASISVTIFAVIITVFSLIVSRLPSLIADGLLLGGLFTLLYGIILSWAGGGNGKIQFLTVLVGLAVALAVAYYKLVKPHQAADVKA